LDGIEAAVQLSRATTWRHGISLSPMSPHELTLDVLEKSVNIDKYTLNFTETTTQTHRPTNIWHNLRMDLNLSSINMA